MLKQLYVNAHADGMHWKYDVAIHQSGIACRYIYVLLPLENTKCVHIINASGNCDILQ